MKTYCCCLEEQRFKGIYHTFVLKFELFWFPLHYVRCPRDAASVKKNKERNNKKMSK